MTKKIVALLPMKANSERVKGKNFRLLAGKPLFLWILDASINISMEPFRALVADKLPNSQRSYFFFAFQ